jgi:hypothetical protein
MRIGIIGGTGLEQRLVEAAGGAESAEGRIARGTDQDLPPCN